MNHREDSTAQERLDAATTDQGDRAYDVKQTEIGEIPEEWEVIQIETIVKSFKNGIYKSRVLWPIYLILILFYPIMKSEI